MTTQDHTTIRDRVLNPALDGIALNHEQSLLIFNPTREIDSLAEVYVELQRLGVPPDLLQAKAAIIRRLAEKNAAEGDDLREIAGIADLLAKRRKVADEMTVRGIARTLRPHLKVLVSFDAGETVDPMCFVQAGAAIGRILDMDPPALLQPSLRNQLGNAAHGKLMEIWAERGEG